MVLFYERTSLTKHILIPLQIQQLFRIKQVRKLGNYFFSWRTQESRMSSRVTLKMKKSNQNPLRNRKTLHQRAWVKCSYLFWETIMSFSLRFKLNKSWLSTRRKLKEQYTSRKRYVCKNSFLLCFDEKIILYSFAVFKGQWSGGYLRNWKSCGREISGKGKSIPTERFARYYDTRQATKLNYCRQFVWPSETYMGSTIWHVEEGAVWRSPESCEGMSMPVSSVIFHRLLVIDNFLHFMFLRTWIKFRKPKGLRGASL